MRNLRYFFFNMNYMIIADNNNIMEYLIQKYVRNSKIITYLLNNHFELYINVFYMCVIFPSYIIYYLFILFIFYDKSNLCLK